MPRDSNVGCWSQTGDAECDTNKDEIFHSLLPAWSPPPLTHTHARTLTHIRSFWVYFIFSLVKICVRAALVSKSAMAPRINMRSEDRKLQAKTLFVSPIAA